MCVYSSTDEQGSVIQLTVTLSVKRENTIPQQAFQLNSTLAGSRNLAFDNLQNIFCFTNQARLLIKQGSPVSSTASCSHSRNLESQHVGHIYLLGIFMASPSLIKQMLVYQNKSVNGDITYLL